MARPRKIYSGTLDATKAAKFYERLHRLKDALEQIQEQYKSDMAEVVEEASEALSVDSALIRQAFTQERQKRKREAKIAKMGASKAEQLEMLLDAASIASDGYDGLVDAVRAAGPRIEDVKAHLAEGESVDQETGEVTIIDRQEGNIHLSVTVDERVAKAINKISAGSPVSGSVRPDKKVDASASVPAPDSHSEGPEETTARTQSAASNPGAVASASGLSRAIGSLSDDPDDIPSFLRRTREPSMA